MQEATWGENIYFLSLTYHCALSFNAFFSLMLHCALIGRALQTAGHWATVLPVRRMYREVTFTFGLCVTSLHHFAKTLPHHVADLWTCNVQALGLL